VTVDINIQKYVRLSAVLEFEIWKTENYKRYKEQACKK